MSTRSRSLDYPALPLRFYLALGFGCCSRVNVEMKIILLVFGDSTKTVIEETVNKFKRRSNGVLVFVVVTVFFLRISSSPLIYLISSFSKRIYDEVVDLRSVQSESDPTPWI